MKKLALFDLDGTLYNTNDINYYAYNEALGEKGYQLDYDFYCHYCNGRHYTVFLPDIIGDDQEVIKYVHDRKKELYGKYLDKVKVNHHLFNIIYAIKKDYNLAVVTTASKKNTYEILDYTGNREVFDLILTQEDITKAKPDPEGFNKAINYFKAKPEDTVIFEDAEVGIEAARKTGASVIVINKF